jgi:spermidine synthase
MGVVTLTAQALLLRELMVTWRGNEISIGIALCVWLASTGAGSIWGAALARRRDDPAGPFALALAAVGLLTPLSVAAARVARPLLGIPPGELAGPLALLAATALTLVPLALASGAAFAAAIASASRRVTGTGRALAPVYVAEALGALVAGLATSIVLLDRVAPLAVALLAAAVALLGAAAALRSVPSGPRGRGAAVACVLAVAALAAAVSPLGGAADRRLSAAAWSEAGFVSGLHSRYGFIVAAERGSQRSLFQNGVLVASVPDRAGAEEAVHLALLQHPAPGRVLLLGAPAEILKHPSVSAVDCVELDPALVGAARRAFGPAIAAGLADARVSLAYADARFLVKRARGPYDAVIVNVPGPTTVQLNRLYTVEFMREVRALLSPDGVAAFSLSSSEDYVGEELARLLATVDRSMRDAFGAVLVTPGDPCHFIGAGRPDYLSRDASVLESRVRERRLDLAHVRGYYLEDRLRPDRVAALEDRLASVETAVNADLAPTCTYSALVLWSERASQGAGVLRAARESATLPNAALAAAALATVLAALRRVHRAAAPSGPTLAAAVAVAGFTGIGVEVAALAALQSIYGFVYLAVALVSGLFMAGLALGGWLGGRAAARGAGERLALALSAGLAAAPLAVAWAVRIAEALSPSAAGPAAALVPAAMVVAAALSGALFPVAGALLAAGRDPTAPAARLYGADLLGAAAGALVCGVVLLPVLGVEKAMAALALLNAAVAIQIVPLQRRCPAAASGGAASRPSSRVSGL